MIPGSTGVVQVGEVLPDGIQQTVPSSYEFGYNFSSPAPSISFGNLNVATGTPDPSGNFTAYPFSNLNSGGKVFYAVTQPDSKLVVAGVNGPSTFVARYFSNGVADQHFSGNGIVSNITDFNNTSPAGLVVEPDGGIVVALNELNTANGRLMS